MVRIQLENGYLDVKDGTEVTVLRSGANNLTVVGEVGNISGSASIVYTTDFESKTYVALSGYWYLKNL